MRGERRPSLGLLRSSVLVLLGGLVFRLAATLPAQAFSPVAARHGMVVSSEPHASEAGLEILRAGGNAVDAAVAVGFALAVTHPSAGNLGGGGFMLIRLANGEAAVVDYREVAAARAHRDMYLDSHGHPIPNASTIGALAVAVPGTVAGLTLAQEKFGRLKLARVMQPAIHLAARGFPVSYALSRSLQEHHELLARFPGTRRVFLPRGKPYAPGQRLVQRDLARTLRDIARRGRDGFYRGRVAQAMVRTMERHDGAMTAADLKQYKARVREPLREGFRGYEILTVPLPSGGGIGLLQMLNILGPLELPPTNSYAYIRLLAETMRRVYADRAVYLGDADFVAVPVSGLLSRDYAAQLRQAVLAADPRQPVTGGSPQDFGSPQTTHFSVIDAEGNAVANTYTLNGSYGSGLLVEGAGFLLNNEMDDFATRPGSPNMFGLVQGEANAVAAGKRPLSAMTPTVVVERGKVRLVLGSPGGGTITNTVLQVILNVLVAKMNIRQAVTAPRFHHQWMPDRLSLEQWGFSADTLQKLAEAGYTLNFRSSMGACHALEVDPGTGWRFGCADPREDGKAVGY